MERKDIHIVLIGGSVRPGNYTNKALRLVMDELEKEDEISVEHVDPADLDLPPPGGDATEDSKRLTEAVRAATGLVLVTPEYHGSMSSVIKHVIESLGFPSGLSGKPVALLGVAAGAIGAIKSLEQLRGVCSHIGALVLPSTVSVAHVQKVFDEDGRCLDARVEGRVRSVADTLLDYIRGHICPGIALEQMVRED